MDANNRAILDKISWNDLLAYLLDRSSTEFKKGEKVHRTDAVSWEGWTSQVVEVRPRTQQILVEINRPEKGRETYWQPILSYRKGEAPKRER